VCRHLVGVFLALLSFAISGTHCKSFAQAPTFTPPFFDFIPSQSYEFQKFHNPTATLCGQMDGELFDRTSRLLSLRDGKLQTLWHWPSRTSFRIPVLVGAVHWALGGSREATRGTSWATGRIAAEPWLTSAVLCTLNYQLRTCTDKVCP
jgi:hypothetical protein